jgi:hypothetical protein
VLVVEAVMLVSLGVVVTVGCLAGQSDGRLLQRHVRQQQQLRRLAHLRPADPASHQRGLRGALNAGVVVGVLVVAVGLLTLV